MEIILNVIEPFHLLVGAEMMDDLKYPLQDNIVPIWAVPTIAILLPLVVILIYYFIRKDVYDLHQAVLGLLFLVLVTGVLTDAIKDVVGRPRPDFFWLFFPDDKGFFDPVTCNVMCIGLKSIIKEGHKSFPSGHTSWCFAGLGFLSWYTAGKIRAFDQRGHVAKLCIIVFPFLIATLVGVSRVDDYWHHWQDVAAKIHSGCSQYSETGSVNGNFLMKLCFKSIFFILFLLPLSSTDLNLDKQALLAFSNSVPHGPKLNRNNNTEICNSWVGIHYTSDGTCVFALRIPAIGLKGPI
ncbi:hypothetical protein Lser_V15G20898 [Lactuca serriola]